MSLNQYPLEVLESWRTSRLGGMYIGSYIVSKTSDPEEESQLERITRILKTRPVGQRERLFCTIGRHLAHSEGDSHPERTKVLTAMVRHYARNILF